MNSKYLIWLTPILLGLSACSTVNITSTPEYTSVDKINKLKKDMDIQQTIQILGCKPFDYYYSSEEGTKTLLFNYKLKEREVSSRNEQLRIGLKDGPERFMKKSELYVTFKDDKIYQVSGRDGVAESRNLLIYENTIREMKKNPEDFIDPGDSSRSLNKEFSLENSRKFDYPSGYLNAPKNEQSQSSSSALFLKKSDAEPDFKKKSPGLAFVMSFFIPGTGEFYAKAPVAGAIFLSMAVTGAVLIPKGLNADAFTESPMAITGTALLGTAWLFSILDAPKRAQKYNEKTKKLLARNPFYHANDNLALHWMPLGGPALAGGSISMRF